MDISGWADRVTVGLGLVLVLLPSLLMPTVDPKERENEIVLRELRQPWRVDWNTPLELLPPSLEKAWNDSLGLRTQLLRFSASAHWWACEEFAGREMEAGRAGWAFHNRDGSLDAWRGALPLSKAAIEGWVALHRSRRQIVEGLGARYVICLAPSKAAIYPEQVPARFVRVGPSRRAEWTAALEEAGLEVIDIESGFLAARIADDPAQSDFLFHQMGTHWSGRGERVAAALLLARLGLPPSPQRWHWTEGERQKKDSWSPRLYLEHLFPVPTQEWWPDPPIQGAPIKGAHNSCDFPGEGSAAARLLLLSDSYGASMAHALAGNLSLRNLWTYEFDPARIAEFQPDIVCSLQVDRVLEWVDPSLAPNHHPGLLAQRFQRGQSLPCDLSTKGQVRVKVLGLFEEPRPIELPLQLETGGEPLVLLLTNLPRQKEEAVLALDLVAPRAGAVEWAVGSGLGVERILTQRTLVRGGLDRAWIHLDGRNGPRDSVLALWLDAGQGQWRIEGLQLRAIESTRGDFWPLQEGD